MAKPVPQLESLSREKLVNLAMRLGRSQKPEDHARAAEAWTLVAELSNNKRDQLDSLGRAALALADAGAWRAALPKLKAMIARPRAYEYWLPEYAAWRLLDKAIADASPREFKRWFAIALEQKLAAPFPGGHSAQERYLAYAVEHRFAAIANHVADVITARCGPRDRKRLAPLIERARALR